MVTAKENWNKAFERIVPTASLAVGVLSVVLATTALMRPIGRRAYYQDGQYLVSVRYPGQWHDLRDFVTPDDPTVLAVSQVGQDAWQLFDFVCRSVSYKRDVGEMWQFPSETLARDQGDCEDTSFLLCSMLRNFADAKVVLGDYQGYGHAWVTNNGFMYETTYTQARPVPDPQHYTPLLSFNDREVVELWSGAFEEMFALRRDEATKLKLMAGALEAKDVF